MRRKKRIEAFCDDFVFAHLLLRRFGTIQTDPQSSFLHALFFFRWWAKHGLPRMPEIWVSINQSVELRADVLARKLTWFSFTFSLYSVERRRWDSFSVSIAVFFFLIFFFRFRPPLLHVQYCVLRMYRYCLYQVCISILLSSPFFILRPPHTHTYINGTSILIVEHWLSSLVT